METFPRELLLELFVFLKTDGKSLVRCCRVCKRWSSVLSLVQNDELLWKRAALDAYGSPDLFLCCASWKDAYVAGFLKKKLFWSFQPCKTFFLVAYPPSRYVYDETGIMAEMRGPIILSYGDEETIVDVARQALPVVPTSILDRKDMLHLVDLSRNSLTCIPPQLSLLTSLTRLFLEYNQIQTLPSQLSELAKLAYLDLQRNQLSSLPSGYSALTNLTFLSLSYNRFTQIPPVVAKMSKLRNLNLCGNQITSVPEEIYSLTALMVLNLSDNLITDISTSFTRLTSLVELTFDQNPFTFLPSYLAKCKRLVLRITL